MSKALRRPEDEAVAAGLRQALLEIHIYQSGHAIDRMRQERMETLARMGALSPRILAFMKSHHAHFFGFPERIAVFEILLTERRYVGFSDGHVELGPHENQAAVSSGAGAGVA